MRTALLPLVLSSAVVVLVGCVGPNPYRPVDLARDLPQDALARYEAEFQAARRDDPHGGHHVAAKLESTNWWPVGLLVFHRRGEVMRMDGPAGTRYMLSEVTGIGPLSLLYAAGRHATYDGAGRRLSGMALHSVLAGHLAMVHQGDARLADGSPENARSLHLVHHLVNVHTMNGHTDWSLFTMPNPVSVSTHRGQ